ncbi:partner of Y14 and mago [Cajanus cajan]|uniref:Partner of Y14 and mago n=1 Tax=Cajanus cajan TaxID=3821 RepID=A0A151R513_CAJCA|nr:partner of Y14 and mago [Cajanus cajan]KYP37602.1 Partner of Y14 and mago [Cajanus cajan]
MSEEDERKKQIAELSKSLKEGERILGPTRRPDGTLRKPIRIRAGYVPQDEVAKYQPKPALLKKETASSGPPGCDPHAHAARPKTKSVKRNERKKEKRLQASLEKEKNLEGGVSVSVSDDTGNTLIDLTHRVNHLALQDSSPSALDLDKRIRALRKKIRLTEALEQKSAEQDLKPEQLEKIAKLEDWRRELKQLEDEKAETTVS